MATVSEANRMQAWELQAWDEVEDGGQWSEYFFLAHQPPGGALSFAKWDSCDPKLKSLLQPQQITELFKTRNLFAALGILVRGNNGEVRQRVWSFCRESFSRNAENPLKGLFTIFQRLLEENSAESQEQETGSDYFETQMQHLSMILKLQKNPDQETLETRLNLQAQLDSVKRAQEEAIRSSIIIR